MKKLLLLLSLFIATAATPNSPAPTTLHVNKKALIEVKGPIGQNMLDLTEQLEAMYNKNPKEIFIHIQSPGGSIALGSIFISAMEVAKARGITIKCFTPVYAASMAFSIMMACSENYVFENTDLLFHPARIVGGNEPITARDAQEIADNLRVIDEELLEKIAARLGVSVEDIEDAFYDEKWWSGKELAQFQKLPFIYVIKDITGVQNLFKMN